MGEYAEMILDGTCCQCCGEFLNDGEDGDGFAVFCAACQPIGEAAEKVSPKKRKHAGPKIKCPVCGVQVKKVGLGDHVEFVHYAARKFA